MNQEKRTPDHWLLVVTFALLAWGVFIVFDASYARAADAPYTGYDSYFFLKRQLIWAGLGILALLIGMKLNYWNLRRFWKPLFYGTLILLVLVLVPGIGKMANGARRWIGYGPVQIQPSELAKLAVIFYLAHHFAKRPLNKWRREDKAAMAFLLVMVLGLIAMEPDLGTALSLAGVVAVMAFLGGAKKRLMLVASGVAVIGVIALIKLEPYRMRRILAWLDPWKYYDTYGYQLIQSLVALGSGGPFGHGPGNSVQKFLYLPACHTDFIFAIVGEELGLIGTLGLIALLAIFCYRGMSIAHRAGNQFGSLLAGGITAMICVQSLLNIAVVTATVPPTGVPLPFISFGGSSLVLTLFSVGVLLSISRNPDQRAAGSEDESHTNGRRDRRTHLSGSKRVGGSIQTWRNRSTIRRHA